MTEDKPREIIYGVISQTSDVENRVAITPDIVTRLKRSSVVCYVESGAGDKASYTDEDYIRAGATVTTRDEVIAKSDVLVFISRPCDNTLSQISAGTWVVGMLGSFTDSAYVEGLTQRSITGVAMERLPRQLSSAQSMDEMTSQNSVTGYKAVLKAADAYGSFFPMMTTAAGTIRPAKVLVLGAGIAGLQAIGTAKRLGAVVTAYDVRPAAREEIESLGAKFLELGVDLSAGQGEGGYARELSAQERQAQQNAVDAKAAEFDIVITTAQVPGRKPPVLLTSQGVNGMKRGSVIVDCAASEFGGNVEGSVSRERVVTDGGVIVLGMPDLASQVATTASGLLARNLADVVAHFLRTDESGAHALSVDLNDEIDQAMVVTAVGESEHK